ncbi:MAG: chemotaxis protein CheX [Lachnospiraceae bacterium]|nr:chemotaxis protein CheX [Lachnospiraceae bacterium]
MANINVEYINPLLKASVKVIQDACRMDVTIGKPSIAQAAFTDDELLILMGITGEMKGQAILDFPNASALKIASAMCMMELPQLDELAQSALCELCNMVMGNTATLYSLGGISIDITPPTLCMGNVTFNSSYAANICIPFNFEGQYLFKIFIAIKED